MTGIEAALIDSVRWTNVKDANASLIERGSVPYQEENLQRFQGLDQAISMGTLSEAERQQHQILHRDLVAYYGHHGLKEVLAAWRIVQEKLKQDQK